MQYRLYITLSSDYYHPHSKVIILDFSIRNPVFRQILRGQERLSNQEKTALPIFKVDSTSGTTVTAQDTGETVIRKLFFFL